LGDGVKLLFGCTVADGLPAYVADPLLGFLDYWKESERLLHAAIQGISMLTAMPKAVEALAKAGRLGESDPYSESLEKARAAADFAEKERARGFPLLHAHALVGAWGAFEAAVEDTVVGILVNEPAALGNEALARVRVPVAEFELLDKEDRMRLLLTEAQRSRASGRGGVDVFESLLEFVGLSGSVEPAVKDTIWELHHVRNVIVHRGSRADRRLVRDCPWMGLKVGDKVIVTHEALGKYTKALCEYTLVVARRMRKHYGIDFDPAIDGPDAAQADQPVIG
jgi:hypothetical protein